MSFVDALRAAVSVALIFSWIALLIALLPTILVTSMAQTRRWDYGIAGLVGGVAGGFSGAASLFLSLWFGCRSQAQGCNTAQGDMGLLLTFPVGSFLGCLVALLSIHFYSGPHPFRNWAYAIASQVAFWAMMIFVFARVMA